MLKLILPIAGVGQRLRPFTFSKPKGFLKIGGQRVVDHILSKIAATPAAPSIGITADTPLAVVYGYKRVQIKEYLDKKYAHKFAIRYIDQIPKGYQGDVPYFGGLGEAILLTRDWFERLPKELTSRRASRSDITLIFLGDMIPVGDYSEVLECMDRENIDGIIGTMQVPWDRTRFYGIVETAQNSKKILRMIEKPAKAPTNLAIAGVYAFTEHTMQRLYAILMEQHQSFLKEQKENKSVTKHASKKEFQFTPALQQLVDEGFHLEHAEFSEGILDFGQPDSLLSGNQILLETSPESIHGAIAEISDSVVKNPSSLGTDTRIIRSVLGPYVSVGDHCLIENCNLQNCVIGDNCHLHGVITRNSIIGDGAKVEKIIKDNIYLGDNSMVLESAPDE
jgi:glucose-1-phosphate thymidylyltransferase